MAIERTYDLVERMRSLGAPDPESWAQSEITEDIAQEATWLLVRAIWASCINGLTPDTVTRYAPASRAIEAGASVEDIIQAMRGYAYEAAFGVLQLLDAGDVEAPADAPGWTLDEVRYDEDGNAHRTGRVLNGVYESLLTSDPSGLEGADFLR
jgi:hypothetical protein